MLRELANRIRHTIENQDCDAIVAVGVDNATYLSGCVFPFADNYPDRKAVVVRTRTGEALIICPFDWARAIRDQRWEESIFIYDENAGMPPTAIVGCLAAALSDLGITKRKIGLDTLRTSKRFMDELAGSLPGVDWVSCDQMLRDLRITKTEAEVELLEIAAKQSDMGIIGALNHLEGAVDGPGYSVAEFSERVRVHIIESGGSGIGHLATMQGAEMEQYYAPQRGIFLPGNLVRCDVNNHFLGYWSNAGRMAFIGQPAPEYAKSYEDNLVLKAAAQDVLQPGKRCDQVFHEVERTAEEDGIRYWHEVGIGHGVGVSQREAPCLHHYDRTLLEPGMVLALDIYTYGPLGELIHSKDIYEIVENGVRLISWYKNWDRLYAVTGSRARH
jgi:Xaa-Pro aminopeptidase